MSTLIKYESLEDKLININNQPVLLDKDVAQLYGVKTKALNQAIKRNVERFPQEYMIELSEDDLKYLRSQNVTTNLKMTRVPPKAFTEKGLYMVATVLKSDKAVEATFAIIETFSKIKELSRNINTITKTTDENIQNELAQRTSQILEEIIDIDVEDVTDDEIVETETKFEFNLGFFKTSKTTKRKKK